MASRLDKLKVKPKPKVEKEFVVMVKKGETKPGVREPRRDDLANVEEGERDRVRVPSVSKQGEVTKPQPREVGKTEIIDKRQETSLNRDDFIKLLKKPKGIVKPAAPAPAPEPVLPLSPLVEESIPLPQEIPQEVPLIPEYKPPDQEPPLAKKIKKIRIKKTKPAAVVEEPVQEELPPNFEAISPDAPQPPPLPPAKKKTIRIRKKKMHVPSDLNIKQFNNANLPKKGKKMLIKASEYYLSNRQVFIDFISNLYHSYGVVEEDDKLTCEKLASSKDEEEFKLLNHQKLVRDYINVHTPYRGILLFHGLGSGKTCSSIAIAEGMKDEKQVVVMTPASLRRNYIEELKSCGDPLLRRNSHWVFLVFNESDVAQLNEQEGAQESSSKIREYSRIMGLSTEFLLKQGGVWLVNAKKEPNYEKLVREQRESLEKQIDAMISNKYTFINYNGLRASHLEKMTENGTINPFDNKVLIVDEVHNLVSRIVNKIKTPTSLNMRLYHLICSAENCRIVFLSGTPIINYPNELGILFNMLRGYVKTFKMTLNVKTTSKVSTETLSKMILKDRALGTLVDFVDYKPSTKTLVFSRNPYGFINSFTRTKDVKGVRMDEKGQVDDEILMALIDDVLQKNKISIVPKSVEVELEKALPDDLDTFKKYFINEKKATMENPELFKRFIMGLVSYFRSANEELMPAYNPDTDFIIEKLEMNDYQFKIYEDARKKERDMERNAAKKKVKKQDGGIYEEAISTYRIFSRLFCNFVFPTSITRPLPSSNQDIAIDENRVDGKTHKELVDNEEGQFSPEDEDKLAREDENLKLKDYDTRIQEALETLDSQKYALFTKDKLGQYSPKFLRILENIENPEHIGSHLIYSQFRTLEGIGILKMVLEANGFAQFKVKKDGVGNVVLDIESGDIDKPKFVLYTGTEDNETKEIYRNAFNSNWKQLPASLSQQLRELGENNVMGDIIKLFMITSSGAEGISLKNCRHTHILEPYWHPVRMEQVIGRIRRICSHQDLPGELQNIKVFLYLMTLSEKQMKSDDSLELRLKDVSKIDNKTPLTTDEALFEISNMKEDINNELKKAMKEASIDCMVYVKQNAKEGLSCLSFGPVNDQSKMARKTTVMDDELDTVQQLNKAVVTLKAVEITLAGKKYAFVKREDAGIKDDDDENKGLIGYVYDYQSFLESRENAKVKPRLVGELVKDDKGSGFVFNVI